MSRIKPDPLSFWLYVIRHSFIAVFNAKETKVSIWKFILNSILALIIGFSVVGFLGWWGLIIGLGNNSLTYFLGFLSSFFLRVLSNATIISANLYFEQRSISDKWSWKDVSSSTWKEPFSSALIVGVTISRTEAHSVQNLKAFLHSVVKDGQIHFQGYGQNQLPIRKSDGVIAWAKSFSPEKPRNILLASLENGKVLVRVKDGQEERELFFEKGIYDVEIGFTADGSVDGHIFKGLLVSDGKSLDLKKRDK